MKKYKTREFDREYLLEDILFGGNYIRNELVDTSRWSTHYELVFSSADDGKTYLTTYSTGSTECQDEQPWEYEDKVTCYEVEPVEVKRIDYKKVAL